MEQRVPQPPMQTAKEAESATLIKGAGKSQPKRGGQAARSRETERSPGKGELAEAGAHTSHEQRA